ncbi:hypothetical protein HWV62_27607 [Athelia sp. TMB]|nr:hypothetical protein HWV62_27607 [Athelia sp. TMB]
MLDEKDQSIFNAPVPTSIPAPPAYDKDAHPVLIAPPLLPPPGMAIPSVNQLHVRKRKGDVTGTYAIDPLLSTPEKQKSKCGGCCSSRKTANASFRSKHGAVALNLATAGASGEHTKAFVEVVTRKGPINIDVFSLQQGKNIHLEAYSRRGDILVLIPRTFCGAIHVRGRKNSHQILPALSSASRLLKSTHKENLLLVGEPSATANGEGTDFLQLRSCRGKIIVGYSGEDQYQPNEVSFWQKFLGGSA